MKFTTAATSRDHISVQSIFKYFVFRDIPSRKNNDLARALELINTHSIEIELSV